jgi:hypothetical protein
MYRTAVVISASLLGVVSSRPVTALAETGARAAPTARRVAIAAGREVAAAPLESVPADLLAINVGKLRRHAESLAKLIGHPAPDLAAMLGPAATVSADAIEWNLGDVGVHAANAYGYASIVDGAVTGFVIRGRAPLDQLQQLHLHRPLQLTRAGGERPSYSIAAGE